MSPEEGADLLAALKARAEAYLRRAWRDRGDALFFGVPRKDGVAPEGFRAEARESGAALYPRPELLTEAEKYAGAAQTELTARLTVCRGRAVEEDELLLWSAGLKLLGGKAPEAEIARYEKRLRQQAAACLRRGSGGALWACALCLEALNGQRDEEVCV